MGIRLVVSVIQTKRRYPKLAQDESWVKLRPKEFSTNADVRSDYKGCAAAGEGGVDKGIEGRKQVQR